LSLLTVPAADVLRPRRRPRAGYRIMVWRLEISMSEVTGLMRRIVCCTTTTTCPARHHQHPVQTAWMPRPRRLISMATTSMPDVRPGSGRKESLAEQTGTVKLVDLKVRDVYLALGELANHLSVSQER
jgi:hypothetical protein